MQAHFSKNQRRIFFVCFLCYVSAYIARLNISAALHGIMNALCLTDAQGGWFQTVFALTYAVGQLVNGSLVDRISARLYLFLGLLFSGICNFLFSIAQTYEMLLLIWMLNGAAQSMLWTPIVKLLATWFRGSRRARASFGLSLSLILGHLSAWAISGGLAAIFNWRLSFAFPALLAVGMSFICLFAIQNNPASGETLGEPETAHVQNAASVAMPVKTMLRTTGLGMVVLCCICNGFVRDGITSWAPTIIADISNGFSANATISSLLIPLLNLLGILLAMRFYHMFRDNARRCAGCLMGLCALLALILQPACATAITCTLVLGLCCSATYGINPMLTTLIPMEYEPVGRIAMVAGLIDCSIYLGSALAGVVTGMISDSFGWSVVFLLWSVVALSGFGFAFLSIRGGRNLQTSTTHA